MLINFDPATQSALQQIAKEMARVKDVLNASDMLVLREAAQLASHHEKMLKASLPNEDLVRKIKQFTKPLSANTELTEKLRQVEEYNKRFTLPLQDQLSEISNSLSNLSSVNTLGFSTSRIADIEKSIFDLGQPWLNVENSLQSINAASELHTIAAGLLELPPFDEKLTDVLRQDLGDWRTIAQFPDSILTDPIERLDFYREQGFNNTLTDFPEAGFDEILNKSGLQIPVLPAPAEQYRSGLGRKSDHTNEEDLELNLEAYEIIFRLETNLRRFIDGQMTIHFGKNWPKHKTPNGMYESWKDKTKRTQSADEPPQPLISNADFSDYILIIERQDNWNLVFRPIFKRKTDIQESMNRLKPVRDCTMHSRVITSDDRLLLLAEARRIFKAIGIIF